MISVIIVTYNRLALLKQCLESLLSQITGATYEIIVVDNCSTDGTNQFLVEISTTKSHRIQYIRNNVPINLVVCKEQAFKTASGDCIACIDHDCIASPHWLDAVVKTINSYDVVGGTVLPFRETLFPWWWRESLGWLVGIAAKTDCTFAPLCSNIAIKRKIFEHIQREQAQFVQKGEHCYFRRNTQSFSLKKDDCRIKICGDDNDWTRRLLRHGYSIVHNKEMVVYHYIPQERLTITYLIKRSWQEGYCWVLWEYRLSVFIVSLIALISAPIRFLFCFDINLFFRMIVRGSYVLHYLMHTIHRLTTSRPK
ncbi:MAG: glycosyltransferase [Candidatus Omnitrophica bacterium]|nr:glycosyltransferase [Candidatus Omnitrophota bacterium]